MGNKRGIYTEDTIEKFLSEGRGLGEGDTYVPWIFMDDFSSKGVSAGIKSWKHPNRKTPVQLLSTGETEYYHSLCWPDSITDIREQYALLGYNNSSDETVEIAEKLGIKHPVYSGSNTYSILTTDFMVTQIVNGNKTYLARTFKLTKDLKGRVLEKFEIEKEYYSRREIDWKIVTENEIDENVFFNVHFLYNSRVKAWLGLNERNIQYIEDALNNEIMRTEDSLANITMKVDTSLGLAPGKSLAVAKYLLANKIWLFDIKKKIDTNSHIDIQINSIREEVI